MNKSFVFLGMTTAFFALATTSYAVTLTIASSNPTSGVAVTMSPNDTAGRNNGTTQFTRTYNANTVVSLTAPAGMTGKVFQKWRKGSTDYSTNRAITLTMPSSSTTMTAYFLSDTTKPVTTASPVAGTYTSSVTVTLTPNEAATTYYCTGSTSCTPTTVYTAPLSFTNTTILRYYSKDVAQNSETTKTGTYTITAPPVNPHAALIWTGPTMCQTCHYSQVNDMFGAVHYQWQGSGAKMINGDPVQGKITDAMNAFCINILGNFGACGSCHIGLGALPSATQSQAQLDNIDCMLCHQKDYKRKKNVTTGLYEPDTANMTITMDQAVQTLHKPVKSNCLQCHAKAGGGDAVKRGDIALASGTTADTTYDRHMATAGGNFACQKCHTFTNHHVAGRGSDIRPLDSTTAVTCSSATCHPTKPTSHTTSAVVKHVARVACQTCHIPTYAKNASDTTATEATETSRDWRVSEWNATLNRWEPTPTKANNLKPAYAFFNGTSWGYNLNDAVKIVGGLYRISEPVGSIADATTASKLTPFKYKTAWQPVTTGQTTNVLIGLSTKDYFLTGVYDTAVKAGLTNMGLPSTTPYTTVQTDEFLMLNHQVPSATGNVLACTSCHISTTATQMNLQNLGYGLKKPTSDLCNDCHGSESYSSSYSSFLSIHSRHVDSQHKKCSNCHNFDRPERTNLN